MERFFKRVCFFVSFRLLAFLVRCTLARFGKIGIIGITGSIGKTTTKEAIAHVLSKNFQVLKTEKNYNTEFGLSLTILEMPDPNGSAWGWFKILFFAFLKETGRLFRKIRSHYDFLVLEMAVNKPGDMKTLLSLVRPHIGVFTGVMPAHMAEGQFASLDEIYREKAQLIESLPKDGIAFLNHDNDFLREHPPKTVAKVVWYGADSLLKLSAENIACSLEGVHFDAKYGDIRTGFSTPILGRHHVNALLPAIGCGLSNGMYMHDIVQALADFRLPPGRMNLIPGIRESFLIDSSYNASPEAVKMALSTLTELGKISGTPAHRKIFVLGNMNELGAYSARAHRDITSHLRGAVDLLITIGDEARKTAEETLKENILPENAVHSFPDVSTARDFVKGLLRQHDLVLIKGSQNLVRLEKLVKYLMAEPERAKELLVRQDWKDS